MEEVFENQTRLPGGQWIYMSDNYTDVVRGCSRQVGSAFLDPVNGGRRGACDPEEGGTFSLLLPCPQPLCSGYQRDSVRSGVGRTRPESHLGRLSSLPDHTLMLACPLLPRTGRRCFLRRTSSAHWAGSGKMRSGPRTSIGPLTSKVGDTWNPVSPAHPGELTRC